MRQGEVRDFQVDAMTSVGEGLCRTGEGVLFVPGALPGEKIRARVAEAKRQFARGILAEVLEPSPDRVDPPCPSYPRCGGCQLQHAAYPAQLRYKREFLIDALRRLGPGLPEEPVEECVPSPSPWGYRSRCHIPVAKSFSGTLAGFYERGSHRIVPWKGCPVLEGKEESLMGRGIDFVRSSRIPSYEAASGKGLVRFLAARYSSRTGQALLSLVLARRPRPEMGGSAARLAGDLRSVLPGLQGILGNVNSAPGNVVFGIESVPLWGKDLMEERMGDFTYHFDGTSFFQVNVAVAELLFRSAAEQLGAWGIRRAAELYAGVGGMTLFLASRVERLATAEEWGPAMKWMRQNLEENRIFNVTPHSFASETAVERGLLAGTEGLILDPPRGGCSEKVLAGILAARPGKILYVSCNPATLARDAKTLMGGGYRFLSVRPYDFFPQTSHVESLALLELP
jgi:23S rRNA (uracil1939-C5)-methyltransferase